MKKWPFITLGVLVVGVLSVTPWAYARMKSGKGISGAFQNAAALIAPGSPNKPASSGASGNNGATGNSTNQPYQAPPPYKGVVNLKDMRTISLTTKGSHKVGVVKTFIDNLGGTYKNGGIEVLNSMYDSESYDATYYVDNQFARLVGYLVPNNWFDKKPPDANIGQLYIYGDGKLLYKSPEVSSTQVKRIQVNVPLNNVSVVRVKLVAGDGKSDGYLGFVNAEFVP